MNREKKKSLAWRDSLSRPKAPQNYPETCLSLDYTTGQPASQRVSKKWHRNACVCSRYIAFLHLFALSSFHILDGRVK